MFIICFLAFAISVELGFNEEEVLQAISTLKRVNGRFETIKSDGGIFFIVDYAHTQMLWKMFWIPSTKSEPKNERLITVFGCGGDRDHAKDQKWENCNQKIYFGIITTDNPRTENPQDIIKEIEAGVEPQNFSKYTSIPDRREAIKWQ